MGNWALVYCFVSFSIIFSGCPKAKVEVIDPKPSTVSTNLVSDTMKPVLYNECDQFLQDYEKWVQSYIALIERYQKNPQDKTIMKDYENMVGQIRTWDIRSRTCINDTAILYRYFQLQELLKEHAKKVLWK
jgi:hypothetical protein